jgi:putative hemolysin
VLGILGAEIAIIVALILANGFFAASELAIVSARRSRLEKAANAGRRGARAAIALSENPDRFLATVQVGITLIGTFAAAFGGARIGDILAAWLATIPALADYADTISLAIVVAGITYLSLVLGELVPKRLALRHSERIAMVAAPVMNAIAWISRPVVALLTGSVNLILLLIGQRKAIEMSVTEEDIVYMVREGTEGGSVEEHEAQFIQRVFRFSDRMVRSVMTPRTDIIFLELGTPLAEAVDAFISSGLSRIPVYEETTDRIVGVLGATSVLGTLGDGGSPNGSEVTVTREMLRPPLFVLESQHIDDVLALFRQHRTHFAIVIDEYGSVAGVSTLQDVLEELVGEIPGEEEAPQETAFVQREDGSWLVDAMEPYDRVLDRVGMPPLSSTERGDFNTLAGLILERLGRIPSVGDTLVLGDHVIEVMDMDGQRIDRVLIARAKDS